MEKRFINPLNIPESEFPLVVLSDQSSGLIEWAIKWRTNASWNHIMIMPWPRAFASQGNFYSLALLKRYMKKNSRLKFWSLNIPTADKHAIVYSIQNKLKLPFWKRNYDWLAIIGQATGLRWFSGPTHICSEDVRYHLNKVIKNIPINPSPEGLNEEFKKRKEFSVYGYWQGD